MAWSKAEVAAEAERCSLTTVQCGAVVRESEVFRIYVGVITSTYILSVTLTKMERVKTLSEFLCLD